MGNSPGTISESDAWQCVLALRDGQRSQPCAEGWALVPGPGGFGVTAIDASQAAAVLAQVDDGGTVDVMPPIPSILPTLPDDLFYPFASGSAATVRPSLALAFASLVAACVRL